MALSLVATVSVCAADAPVTALDRYLAGLATLRAGFAQTLTDSRGRRIESQRGTLVVVRPGRFRWEVRPLSASPNSAPTQIMVADGRNVWFYDVELEQVTVKSAATALTATPAMLLSGAVDVRTTFNTVAMVRSAGLDWVRVTPRRADAEFREARLGFRGAELGRMEIDDRLGQKAVLEFSDVVRNGKVPAEAVQFTPPRGVDVIGTPAR